MWLSCCPAGQMRRGRGAGFVRVQLLSFPTILESPNFREETTRHFRS
jgi:hypothetical protein